MKRLLLLVFFGFAAFCGMTAAASAQATRTWVSGTGDDVNPCSRTAPCKTFAGAISKTQAGGEIDVLDPGGFGTLTITKAITIDGGGGVVASVLASGTVGFTVNAGANDRVVLRNLSINGAGTTLGTNGINFVNGFQLDIEHCTIQGFSQNGVNFSPSTVGAYLNVRDSIIESNQANGILTSTTGTGANRITIFNTAFYDNGTGFNAGQQTRSQISNSILANNATNAVLVNAASAQVHVESSTISNNRAAGLHASNSGIIRVADTMVFANVNGLLFDTSGQIISFGNNRVAGNQTDGTFSSTIMQM